MRVRLDDLRIANCVKLQGDLPVAAFHVAASLSVVPLPPLRSVPSTKLAILFSCEVRGRFVDANMIIKINRQGRYFISNNHGHDHGWTSSVSGRSARLPFQMEMPNPFEAGTI